MNEQNFSEEQKKYQSPSSQNFYGSEIQPTSSTVFGIVMVFTVVAAYWVVNSFKPCTCYGNLA